MTNEAADILRKAKELSRIPRALYFEELRGDVFDDRSLSIAERNAKWAELDALEEQADRAIALAEAGNA